MQLPQVDRRLRVAMLWRDGASGAHAGAVHVSMNDYLIHRPRDVPRVVREGFRIRARWPLTDGALGLWFASSPSGRRAISVSVWRRPEDLRRFVRSPVHLRIMRDFRTSGDLITTAWTAQQLDRALIWSQAADRLGGQIAGVAHH